MKLTWMICTYGMLQCHVTGILVPNGKTHSVSSYLTTTIHTHGGSIGGLIIPIGIVGGLINGYG